MHQQHQCAKLSRKIDIKARNTRCDSKDKRSQDCSTSDSVHCAEMFILPEIETDVQE